MDDVRQRLARGAARAREQPQREPPAERGERLATIKRSEDEEIRVSWDEYEGRPYLSVRLWKRGDGGWWPDSKRGMSIRVRELGDFAAGIVLALDKADALERRG